MELERSSINNVIYPNVFFKHKSTGTNQLIIKKSKQPDKHLYALKDVASPTSHIYWSALPSNIKNNYIEILELRDVTIFIKEIQLLSDTECHNIIRFFIESRKLTCRPHFLAYTNSSFSELSKKLSGPQKALIKFFDLHDYNAFDDSPIGL